MQAVVRGRRVRSRLAQARAAVKLPNPQSRPYTPDSEIDLDSMQDFLDSLPDTEPASLPDDTSSASCMAQLDLQTSPLKATLSASHAGRAGHAVHAQRFPQGSASTASQLSPVSPAAAASSFPRLDGQSQQTTAEFRLLADTTAAAPSAVTSDLSSSATQAPAVLPSSRSSASVSSTLTSTVAAPTAAQAFAHTPALAKRFQALQKQQSSKATGAPSLQRMPHTAQSEAAAEAGSATGSGRSEDWGSLDAKSADSVRRQSHGLASPSGRSPGSWLGAGVPAPAFAAAQSAASRAAQNAQHGQLQTILEGNAQPDSMASQEQGVVLPQIRNTQRANHAGAPSAADTHTPSHSGLPSWQPSFTSQLPAVKAASPPLTHPSGPRRVNSDIASVRMPQPHRTASDVHISHGHHDEAGAAHGDATGSVRGEAGGSWRGARSASSLQSEQSISSQASHKAAIKEQKHKVQLVHCSSCFATSVHVAGLPT